MLPETPFLSSALKPRYHRLLQEQGGGGSVLGLRCIVYSGEAGLSFLEFRREA